MDGRRDMSRSIDDLVEMLFDQLETVQTTKVDDIDKVESVCELTKAVNTTAHNIIAAGNLTLQAAKMNADYGSRRSIEMPALLAGDDE